MGSCWYEQVYVGNLVVSRFFLPRYSFFLSPLSGILVLLFPSSLLSSTCSIADLIMHSHHLTRVLFCLFFFSADSSFEFSKDWNRRIASNKIYLFEKIVISDRISGHRGPKCKGKPFDEVFELSVPTDWVTDLREAILAGYSGDVKPAASANGKGAGKGKKMGKGKGEEKPVITYMSRQTAKTRTLTPESHEALIKELQKIEDEGLAEFNVEEFTDLDPKDEQVAKIARTTVSPCPVVLLFSFPFFFLSIFRFLPFRFRFCMNSLKQTDSFSSVPP